MLVILISAEVGVNEKQTSFKMWPPPETKIPFYIFQDFEIRCFHLANTFENFCNLMASYFLKWVALSLRPCAWRMFMTESRLWECLQVMEMLTDCMELLLPLLYHSCSVIKQPALATCKSHTWLTVKSQFFYQVGWKPFERNVTSIFLV